MGVCGVLWPLRKNLTLRGPDSPSTLHKPKNLRDKAREGACSGWKPGPQPILGSSPAYLQDPLDFLPPFPFRPGPFPSHLSVSLDPVILVFVSTGQTKSLKKTENLLAMVKKLQKGHVSPCISGLPGVLSPACASNPAPQFPTLGNYLLPLSPSSIILWTKNTSKFKRYKGIQKP